MNLGQLDSLTVLVGLIATCLAILGAVFSVGSRLWRWISQDRVQSSLDRMEDLLAQSNRLAAIGESYWAAEGRKRAWMVPLRQLARFEVNRKYMHRFFVAYVGCILYVVGMILAVLGASIAWLSMVGGTCVLLSAFIALWWVVSKGRFENEVTKRAESKYLRHVRGGRVE